MIKNTAANPFNACIIFTIVHKFNINTIPNSKNIITHRNAISFAGLNIDIANTPKNNKLNTNGNDKYNMISINPILRDDKKNVMILQKQNIQIQHNNPDIIAFENSIV